LVLALFVCILLLIYASSSKDLKGIPGPRGYPIFGTFFLSLKNRERLLEFVVELTEKYGKVWTFWAIGAPPRIGIMDPKSLEWILKTNFKNYEKGDEFHNAFEPFLGDGIFNADGILWKKQRQVASALFTKNELLSMSELSVKNGFVVLEQLSQVALSKKFCDIQEIFQRFSLDTIGELAFGVEIGSLKSKVPFAISFDNANKGVVQRSFHPFYRIWFLNWLLPYTRVDKDLRQTLRTLDQFSYQVIKERKNVDDLEERKDLLSRYLCMTDDEGIKFSDKYLRDIMINLILAGRDSASQLVTWTCYLLSQNPEKEKKLLQEIDEELRGETPSLHNVKNLKYLKAVLDETLRIWPPVPIERKYALEDDQLPNGTFIPKGTVVVWSVWAMGRMSEFWENPMEFLPERWLETENIHNPAFIPFLIGPRTCLGQNMAYLQAKILLCLLYQKFTFSHVPHHIVTYDSAITLKARFGMEMFVQNR